MWRLLLLLAAVNAETSWLFPCASWCPSIFQPICALCPNGPENFGNDCKLSRHNECDKNNECVKLHEGECGPSSCQIACPLVYQPLCAQCQDGNEMTFGNACQLGGHNTCNPKKKCTQLHKGECGNENPGGPLCPTACTEEYKPVCAQCPNGKQTFSNACFFQQHYCQTGEECTLLEDGACEEQCPRLCPFYDVEVCAICNDDMFRTFPNTCLMENYNCQNNDSCRNISQGVGKQCPPRLPKGPGPVIPQPSDCYLFCPAIRQPLCARCGRTARSFQNGCALEVYNCRNDNECVKIRSGNCTTCPAYRCSNVKNPICAQCGFKRRTFDNECLFNLYNCPAGTQLDECKKLHDGGCDGENPGGPLCPAACTKEYKPVCAQCPNGKQTFSNACLLQQHYCQTGEECTLLEEGTCEEQCIRPCPFFDVEVCAVCKDGTFRTFPNTCFIENYNCQNNDHCRNISQGVGKQCPPRLPMGPGPVILPQPSDCDSIFCPAIRQPLCARCGRTARSFQNGCALEVYNCRNNNECVKIRSGNCTTCPAYRCSNVKNPICAQCGTKRRTFDNECLFNSHNCPTGIQLDECKKLYDGGCHDDNPGETTCPDACTKEYRPVCAQCPNGQQTFSNLCLLRQNNCQSRGGCTYLRDGECSSEPCSKDCPKYDIKICAVCATNVYRTFPNPCVMENHNCRSDENCQYVSQGGTCPVQNPNQPPSFPTDPAQCAAITCSTVRDPVCARCGHKRALRTFDNACLLGIHNCFNNQECHQTSGKACEENPSPVICSTQRDPECATCLSGPRTFQNQCFLNSFQLLNSQENCTKLYSGRCRTTCPLYKCPFIIQPICALCGFEQRQFDNECIFNSYNCPTGFECTKINDGPCSSVPPLLCTAEYNPVCAQCSYGLETFANECFLKAQNLANPDAICVQRSRGSCVSSCVELNCINRAFLVCGLCGNQKITFFNACQFRNYNCKSGYACRILHPGGCQ